MESICALFVSIDVIVSSPLDPYAFLAQLREDSGFANPSSTDNLKLRLGIGGYDSQTKPTLVISVQK